MGRPLKIAKAHEILTLTATTAASGSTPGFATVSGGSGTNPTTYLLPNMRFTVATTTGGLVAGTTYYILKVLNGTTFTVSATDLTANPTNTAATLTTTTAQTVALTVGAVDTGFNNPNGSGNTYGVTGGNTGSGGKQILANVAIGVNGTGTLVVTSGSNAVVGTGTAFNTQLAAGSVLTTRTGTVIGYVDSVTNAGNLVLLATATDSLSGVPFVFATPEAGYIVRQKGKQKYLVKGATSGLTGACYTANVANTAMTPNTMTLTATYANASTAKVQSLNDRAMDIFSATSGPIATGNIVIANTTPAYASFNAAAVANAANGQPFPIVTITNS